MEFEINALDDVKKALENGGSVVGISINAFDRIDPVFFCKDYRIVCLSDCKENSFLKKYASIFCISEHRETKDVSDKRKNVTTVLRCKDAIRYLRGLNKPNPFIYRYTEKVKRLCEKHKIPFKQPQVTVDLFDKIFTRNMFEKCNLKTIEWEVKKLSQINYSDMKGKYGKFVMQIPCLSGGRGTFFIDSEQNLIEAKKKIMSIFRGEGSPEMLITKFVDGFSPSITCCVTKHGILYTKPQHQVLDVEECINQKSNGIFCGHEWGCGFRDSVSEQSYEIAENVGSYVKSLGYRGIVGIDMIIDKETGIVYPLECNFRLLGSFPVLTMFQVENNGIPLSALHILENNSSDYIINTDAVNEMLKGQKSGSQLFLTNKLKHNAVVCGDIEAGVHELSGNEIVYKRPGFNISELKNNEFILTGGVPLKNSFFLPNQRMFRILSKQSMYDFEKKKLTPEASKIVKAVYRKLDMRIANGPDAIFDCLGRRKKFMRRTE